MLPNALKAKLQRGEITCGMFVTSSDPSLVELAGEAGLDSVFIDCEHSPIGLETVENMARAAERWGVTALVRVPTIASEVVLRHIDRGVGGIIFPRVNTAEDAARAVRYTKFAPLGERGYGLGAISRWARGMSVDGVHDFANRETMVVCLVEESEGFRNIEQIARVPGVDAIITGPGDLCQTMGYIREWTRDRGHPEVDRVVVDGIRKIKEAGIIAAFDGAPQDIARLQLRALGVQMFHFPAWSLFLNSLRNAIAEVKA